LSIQKAMAKTAVRTAKPTKMTIVATGQRPSRSKDGANLKQHSQKYAVANRSHLRGFLEVSSQPRHWSAFNGDGAMSCGEATSET
jgi:hypothetical protein